MADGFAHLAAAFRQGLKDAGLVEGQSVAIEYRYAENQVERLPGLVADLLRRPVALIAGNSTAMLVAKAATTTCRSSLPAVAIRSRTASSPASTGQAAT